MKSKNELIQAILREIKLQKDYLDTQKINSIYFGGGTPSLLEIEELNAIFEQIFAIYSIDKDTEITLEANPDDLTLDKLKTLAQTPINRLSIGIQSFSEDDLRYMNRAHTAEESIKCIEQTLEVGFQNLTVDLIYGTPTMSFEQWQQNIEMVLKYEIPHISCYCLTVEPKTALDHFVKTGKFIAPDDEQAAQQFEYLIKCLENAGYDHYEISNFALPNHYAKHNSNYWLGESYLGIGPSAHSFNGNSRQWNVAHNTQYIKSIFENKIPFTLEELSPKERYNEYVMTSLRTIWGCDLEQIRDFDLTFIDYFVLQIQPFLENQTVCQKGNQFFLTKKGKLLADNIAMELFL